MSRYALVSVSDKEGIEALGHGLVGLGFTILSTGGTAAALKAAGVPVTKVSEHTGAPEIMDGRVKTLHPRIHGGILGDRDRHAGEATAHEIPWIDVVVVNLYPFERVTAAGADLATAVENIDIGGPTMVRAAAKNHRHVTVVVDPSDYARVLDALRDGGSATLRRELAVKAFRHTARYDAVISTWLAGVDAEHPPLFAEGGLPVSKVQDLRYGENPHQRAAFYADGERSGRSLARARQVQGKELSFNNLNDLDGALRAVFDLGEPACVIVKHTNPCGVATGPSLEVAYERALACDPISAYGGIVVFNRPVGPDVVRAVKQSKVFYEVLAAPGFEGDALARLATRENLRVLELPADWAASKPPGLDAKRVQGGWLFQDWDLDAAFGWQVVTARAPSASETRALHFAWRVCRHVKSNAIVLARDLGDGLVLVGAGGGQTSRVDAVKIAVGRGGCEGSALASDAFFPFDDGVKLALEAGVRAFIQPGGSIRDADAIAAADAAGATMVFTGTRHFRH